MGDKIYRRWEPNGTQQQATQLTNIRLISLRILSVSFFLIPNPEEKIRTATIATSKTSLFLQIYSDRY